MGKYYILSKDLRVVIAGPHIANAREAAKEALLNCVDENTKLAPRLLVSEIGFDIGHEEDDEYFDTVELMEEAGFEYE
jgi:hypothetical protein